MHLCEQLKMLAHGANPETGEVLGDESLTNKPEVIRMLFLLAEELSGGKAALPKVKLTPEERRQKNIADGKPAKSHFPWEEGEKTALAHEFESGLGVEQLAERFERSTLAIVVQLEKMKLIPQSVLESYRSE